MRKHTQHYRYNSSSESVSLPLAAGGAAMGAGGGLGADDDDAPLSAALRGFPKARTRRGGGAVISSGTGAAMVFSGLALVLSSSIGSAPPSSSLSVGASPLSVDSPRSSDTLSMSWLVLAAGALPLPRAPLRVAACSNSPSSESSSGSDTAAAAAERFAPRLPGAAAFDFEPLPTLPRRPPRAADFGAALATGISSSSSSSLISATASALLSSSAAFVSIRCCTRILSFFSLSRVQNFSSMTASSASLVAKNSSSCALSSSTAV